MKKIFLLITIILTYTAQLFAQCQSSFTYTNSGSAFSFTNTSTPLATGATVLWTFGDGNTSTQVSPQHTYAQPGSYEVCLVVVDFTCFPNPTMQFCDSITVPGIPVTCQASFTYTNNGTAFSFTNTSTPLASGATIAWSFGDGNTSTQVSPQHTYAQSGSYEVCLLIIDFTCLTNPTMQFCDSITITSVGINEKVTAINNLNLYPSPVKDKLTIELNTVTTQKINYIIYNVLGKEIFSEKGILQVGNNTKIINTSDWNSGIYFVSILTEDGSELTQTKFLK